MKPSAMIMRSTASTTRGTLERVFALDWLCPSAVGGSSSASRNGDITVNVITVVSRRLHEGMISSSMGRR